MKTHYHTKVILTLISAALTYSAGSVYYHDHQYRHLPCFIGFQIVTILLFCLVSTDRLNYWLQKEDLKSGDIFQDKKWGDTIIEITSISPDKKRVRYIFKQIQGVVMDGKQSLSENSIHCILSEFIKVK